MFSEDFTEFKHSKSITKPNFQLQQKLALHHVNLLEGHFIFFKEEERIAAAILFTWQLGNLSSRYGRCAMTVSVEGYFKRILGTH